MCAFLKCCLLLLLPLTLVAQPNKKQLIIRCDDIGMCHAVNMAAKKMAETGLPFSASVMFACPWYQEAVEMLRNQPQVAIGIHLTLTSEWKSYRWGPITGRTAVPSLVDSLGYFRATVPDFLRQQPKLEEIETEFRAQIKRAIGTGLPITYMDYHMGAGTYTPEQRKLLEKLAGEYQLSMSGNFAEQNISVPSLPSDQLTAGIINALQKCKPGNNLMVFHLGLETPEMDALQDLNPGGVKQMSRQRHGELKTLTSPGFKAALQKQGITPVTYRSLTK